MKRSFICTLSTLIIFLNINTHAQTITTIAGMCGIYGYSGDGGQATAAAFGEVDYVAIDANNNIYIGDRHCTLRKVNPMGIISTFAGMADSLGYGGDGGPATNAKLRLIEGIAFDKKGDVYISDNGNSRIRMVDTTGIITTFAGNGSTTISGTGGPATAAGIGNTSGICFDAAGNLYIAVSAQIKKVDTQGIITVFAGTGIGGYSGDGGPATNAQIAGAYQIEMDADGNLYIADEGNYRIRKVDATGIITTLAGNGTRGYSGDNGPATAAEFYDPTGVFPDQCSNIYIADYEGYRIRKVNGSGYITTIAGNGHGEGSVGTGGSTGNGGPATAAEMNMPEAVYLDNRGNIYIADQMNYCVRYIQMDGCVNTTASPGLSEGEEMLRVFPNPSMGDFTFKLSSVVDEDVQVVVTNMMGEVVHGFSTVTNKETAVRLHVAAGVYFVSACTSEGRYNVKVCVN